MAQELVILNEYTVTAQQLDQFHITNNIGDHALLIVGFLAWRGGETMVGMATRM